MSDSMRPRADDCVPPCMDFDNPGAHRFGPARCVHCGAEAASATLSALVREWRETARTFDAKGGDICCDIAEHYRECANRLQAAITEERPAGETPEGTRADPLTRLSAERDELIRVAKWADHQLVREDGTYATGRHVSSDAWEIERRALHAAAEEDIDIDALLAAHPSPVPPDPIASAMGEKQEERSDERLVRVHEILMSCQQTYDVPGSGIGWYLVSRDKMKAILKEVAQPSPETPARVNGLQQVDELIAKIEAGEPGTARTMNLRALQKERRKLLAETPEARKDAE